MSASLLTGLTIGLVTLLVSTAGASSTDTWAMFSTLVTAVSLTVALNVAVTVAPAGTSVSVQEMVEPESSIVDLVTS